MPDRPLRYYRASLRIRSVRWAVLAAFGIVEAVVGAVSHDEWSEIEAPLVVTAIECLVVLGATFLFLRWRRRGLADEPLSIAPADVALSAVWRQGVGSEVAYVASFVAVNLLVVAEAEGALAERFFDTGLWFAALCIGILVPVLNETGWLARWEGTEGRTALAVDRGLRPCTLRPSLSEAEVAAIPSELGRAVAFDLDAADILGRSLSLKTHPDLAALRTDGRWARVHAELLGPRPLPPSVAWPPPAAP